ncbi:Wzz/FepE/Etk N-terminal domain-containing protein [Lutibacter sp. B1]|uniref:Wzz/FepE/Etk N-terminal domain-containing protein n=1 Tax=Lutibacter sp. B1 TaxID=2725996 RepID=UPI001457569C|nr:Wzz/FepE/Etk N-terminal domain-containing protein [Lutibacter sp. B1]NLP58822.1 exopolysaccharide biosynthesis protein [Lutibacter sp. B1]
MTKDTTKLPEHPIEDDEIDLIALAKTLWNGRKTIIKTTLIFMAIGLFIAIFSQKEYTASTTFVPQTSNSKVGGSLGGLAAMAGINLGGMSSESGIPPTLYPQIITSIPFQKELLQNPLTIEGQSQPVSFTEYYTTIYSPGILGYIKKYTIGLPGILIKAIQGKSTSNQRLTTNNQILTISEEEKELIERLNNQVSLSVNDKEGYITLSSNMPEALNAAELTKNAQELLQQYIINFKVQKSAEQLKFIQERYTEKEKEFRIAQQQLASFNDRNLFMNSALAQTTLTRLQSEYDLAYSVYSELAKQVETQQIQVKEDTPVFTVVKPVVVPIEKSKPKRFMILVIFVFVGVVVSITVVLGRKVLRDLKRSWNKEI